MKRRPLLALLASGVTGCAAPDFAADQGESIPGGAEEPPEFPEADEVIYPASGEGRIEMTPSTEEAELPVTTIEFQATNTHWNLFETNFHDWRIHTLVDGEWWFLGVFAPFDTADTLWPGESHTWEVTIDNEALGTPAEELAPSARSSVTVTGLGSGIYSFSVVGEFHGDETNVAAVTPFVLGGEDVPLVPSPDVETTREGDTVLVTEMASNAREHRIEAIRRDSTRNTTRLPPEWGLREPGIRNTVPFLSDGVRNVVFSRSQPVVHDENRVEGTTFTYGNSAVAFDLS